MDKPNYAPPSQRLGDWCMAREVHPLPTRGFIVYGRERGAKMG